MLLLWLVLANYENVVVPAFCRTFVVTVLIFAWRFLSASTEATERWPPAKNSTPTEYIQHHLTFLTQAGRRRRLLDAARRLARHRRSLLGVVGIGFIWWVVRGATAGVPGKRQAFVELLVDFVDEQVKGIFHGDRNRFVAPLALTVFVWVLLMNAMDFLPVDIMALGHAHVSSSTTCASCRRPTSTRPSRWRCRCGC